MLRNNTFKYDQCYCDLTNDECIVRLYISYRLMTLMCGQKKNNDNYR